jgi:hypothetical protein
MAEKKPLPPAETFVRHIAYGGAAICVLWLVGALTLGAAWLPSLVGTIVFTIYALPMYLKQQEYALQRESVQRADQRSAQQSNTSRWEVEDNSDPTVPPQKPKILES